MASSFDVCIVGAGLSGLSCAHHLKKLNPALSIAILEARDRVGGRSWTVRLGDGLVDVGGQWIGASQPRVRALVAELGLTLVPQRWLGGEHAREVTCGERNSFVAEIPVRAGPPDVSAKETEEIAAVIEELDRLALTVPTQAPWTAARAKEWDSITVEDFLKARELSEVAMRELRLAVQTILASEPRDLSFLYFLFFVHAAGGFRYLSDGPGGAQHFKVVTGAQSICVRLAERLEKSGVSIVLNAAVKMIRSSKHGTTIYVDTKSSTMTEYSARRVVVAVPPPVAAAIDIFPGCTTRALLGHKMHMGAVVKVVCVFAKSFWTDAAAMTGMGGAETTGKSKAGAAGAGVGVSASERTVVRIPDVHYSQMGPVSNVFDATIGDKPALVGLVVGDQARAWMGRTDSPLFRAAVLQQYARMFASKKALHPLHFVAKSWMEEPLSQGCYAAVMGKHVMTSAGPAMFEPVGTIHWAGTEAATEWNGYFEGAVQAGQREATAIASSLSAQSSSSVAPVPAVAVTPMLFSKL